MACDRCGTCSCQCGSLPYTLTAQVSGVSGYLKEYICPLEITATFGSGAVALATEPGGDPPRSQNTGFPCGYSKYSDADCQPSVDKGPLTAVMLKDGGACYAKLGRVAPILTASAGGGSEATLTITTTEAKSCDDFGLPHWYVSKIAVSGGGGYKHNTPVTITHSVGDTKIAAAEATLQTAAREEPDFTLSAAGGTGATLTPAAAPTGWGIDAIEVESSGKTNTYGLPVSIIATIGDFGVSAAAAVALTTLIEPSVGVYAAEGSGATLRPTLTEKAWIDGRKCWTISSLSIDAGGTGYKKGSVLTAITGDKTELAFCGKVSAIGTGGSISAVSILEGGAYYKETGVIESVKVIEPGCYYRQTKGNPPTEPFLTASGVDGSLTVKLKPVAWGVSGITVEDGGEDYKYGAKVSVVLGDGDFLDGHPLGATFSATAKTTLAAPTISLAACEKSGSGAALTPTLQSYTDEDGVQYWGVSSIAIKAGGVNYEVGDDVLVTISAGTKRNDSAFSSNVTKIDEDTGEIKAVTVHDSGKFYRDTGVISSVSITNRGRYYNDLGTPTGITLQSGGRYYREDADVAPYVADVTVIPCWGGTGAEISATVDSTVTSSTFGQITKLTIDKGGDDYLAWHYWYQWKTGVTPPSNPLLASVTDIEKIDASRFNHTATLAASSPVRLVGTSVVSSYGSGACVSVGPLCIVDQVVSSIERAVVENPGSGYAKIGREQPTITISANEYSSGSGASFTATLKQTTDSIGLDCWQISSAKVSGGSCYGVKGRTLPPLTASATPGSGAYFAVIGESAVDDCGGNYVKVGSVYVLGGTGYQDGSEVTITAPANAVVRTPATATLQATDGVPTGIIVTEPGAYFIKGPDEPLQVGIYQNPLDTVVRDEAISPALLTLQTDDDGAPTGVTVVEGGAYYRENKTLPPLVASVSVEIDQATGSNGSGAELSATVDSDYSSSTFGTISKVEVVQGGSGYTFYGASKDCEYVTAWGVDRSEIFRYNYVIPGTTPEPPATLSLHTASGGPPSATLSWRFYPVVRKYSPNGWEGYPPHTFTQFFSGSSPLADCRDFSVSLSADQRGTGTITVTPGGTISHKSGAVTCEAGVSTLQDIDCDYYICTACEGTNCPPDKCCYQDTPGQCVDCRCYAGAPCPPGTCCGFDEGSSIPTCNASHCVCLEDSDCDDLCTCVRVRGSGNQNECRKPCIADCDCPDDLICLGGCRGCGPPPPPATPPCEGVTCPPGKYCDPNTGQCVDITGCCLVDACECEVCDSYTDFWCDEEWNCYEYPVTNCYWLGTDCNTPCPTGDGYTGQRRSFKVPGQSSTAAGCQGEGGQFTENAVCNIVNNEWIADPLKCCITEFEECVTVAALGTPGTGFACTIRWPWTRIGSTKFVQRVTPLPPGETECGQDYMIEGSVTTKRTAHSCSEILSSQSGDCVGARTTLHDGPCRDQGDCNPENPLP